MRRGGRTSAERESWVDRDENCWLARLRATVGAALVGTPATARGGEPVSPEAIAQLLAGVPGTVTYKILAPATMRTRRVDVSAGADQQLFIGSAFKALVLAETLRQADSLDVVDTITGQQLELNATVWSPDSATFNAPHLTGPSRSARRWRR